VPDFAEGDGQWKWSPLGSLGKGERKDMGRWEGSTLGKVVRRWWAGC